MQRFVSAFLFLLDSYSSSYPYINHLLNHICHIAVRYGEVRINPDSTNYFCYRKKAIRIIYNLNYHDHTSVFFHSSKMLKLHDLVTYKTMVILYKANNHSLNGRVQAFFKPTEAIYEAYVKKPNTTLRLMSLPVKGIKTWNSLVNEITQLPSLTQLKKKHSNLQHIYKLLIESDVN